MMSTAAVWTTGVSFGIGERGKRGRSSALSTGRGAGAGAVWRTGVEAEVDICGMRCFEMDRRRKTVRGSIKRNKRSERGASGRRKEMFLGRRGPMLLVLLPPSRPSSPASSAHQRTLPGLVLEYLRSTLLANPLLSPGPNPWEPIQALAFRSRFLASAGELQLCFMPPTAVGFVSP